MKISSTGLSMKDFEIITDVRDEFGHKIVARKKSNSKIYKIDIYKKRFVNEEKKNRFIKEKKIL
jgi:hypothetical protein